MKLKTKEQLAAHITAFPGLTPERKAEIADHLVHLPDSHHDAVRTVLEREDNDPETKFVRGCFADPATAPTGRNEPRVFSEQHLKSMIAEDNADAEHPGLPPAA